MAQWFKYRKRVRSLVAAMGVTVCVATGVAFGQYGNSDSLNWRTPVVHGQQTNQVRQAPRNLQQVQLVQHLEPAQTPALLPSVDIIDNNQAPQQQPIYGTRVAQVPNLANPGMSDAMRDTMYREQGRPGSVNSPMVRGSLESTPANTYSSLSDNAITGSRTQITTPVPGEQVTREIICGDPRAGVAPMGDLSVLIDVDIDWEKLGPCSINVEDYQPRQWPRTCVNYNPSLACTTGAYFEHVQVERYGHSWGPFMQPIMSAAHFYGSVLFLPYKMGLTPPSECVYTIGYYRPGSCAPYMIDPIPLSVRAGLMQAGATVGLAYVIP